MADIGPADLAEYRLASARDRLKAARTLLDHGMYSDAASRAYYAVFQAARAVLATRSMDARRHSGVIGLFNLHFVKAGVLPRESGRILKNIQDLRRAGDYDDFYLVSKEEAVEAVEKAGRFIRVVADFLNTSHS